MAFHESSASPALPELSAPCVPREIRDALVGSERVEFERRYGEEMAASAQTLDLTGVFALLATFGTVAETTRRHGVDSHIRMLAQVADLKQGWDVADNIDAAAHRAEINAKLGL
ncbi:DUF6247 family protein [Nocardia sp. NPDC050175]|uniref:DUF6247 family protein n=1 Tax=Nocardia sp. NPDC050175 TaxID=3364317 RepID=UPI0037A4F1FA